jgi:K+ transporter
MTYAALLLCPAAAVCTSTFLQAVSPHHAIAAFTGPGGFKAGWTLLAGVMLCITGAEAMYADLGHFNAQAVTVRLLAACTNFGRLPIRC